jgi:hypothetical protein
LADAAAAVAGGIEPIGNVISSRRELKEVTEAGSSEQSPAFSVKEPAQISIEF